MTNRYSDAIAIQCGACNPHGIVNSLSRALKECRDEGSGTQDTTHDPAIRLIVHQLAFIRGIGEIEGGDPMLYSRLIDTCAAKDKDCKALGEAGRALDAAVRQANEDEEEALAALATRIRLSSA